MKSWAGLDLRPRPWCTTREQLQSIQIASKIGLERGGKYISPFSVLGLQTDPTLPLPPIELTPLRTSDPAPFNASFRYGRENEGLRCFAGDIGECGGDFDEGEIDAAGNADGRERDDEDDGGIAMGRVVFIPSDLAVSSLLGVGENWEGLADNTGPFALFTSSGINNGEGLGFIDSLVLAE